MAERASGGKMTPLDPYHVTVMRAGYAAGIVANGPQDWFGPLDPQPPSAPPEVAGRALDFPAGFNLNIEPRAYESIKFADLRSLADSYDLLRLVDGSTYGLIGRFMGKSRMGTLTAPLPSVAPAPTGQTIDAANTLAVDISETGLTLNSGTQQDAVSGNTLCYVDGEYIAYQTATLTAVGKYSLTYLVRGLFGTTPAPHAAGAPFARIDGQVLRIPFTQDRIGQPVYFKFLSFNQYGGAQEPLAQAPAYSTIIRGTALASPLPNVQNLVSSYVASITTLSWDEVRDFRPVLYEVRKGATWSGGQVLGRVAHPPFPTQGNGIYWVAAYSQPAANLQVYSQTPSEIVIAGAVLTKNVIASWDEGATGWTGTCGAAAGVAGAQIQLFGTGNILADPDFLNTPDILDYGGIGSGTYQIPAGHEINIGRVAPCMVLVSWGSLGQVVGSNILKVVDFLGMADVLGYSASANTNVYPEIQVAQGDHAWGPWQKFSPGQYSAQYFRARMQMQTADPATTAILQSFVFSVDVPDRVDHYNALAVPAAGTSLTFQPDGAASPAPFNGGNGGQIVPNVQVTILGAQQGDTVSLTAVTTGGCTIQILNGGVGVARTVNVVAQGW